MKSQAMRSSRLTANQGRKKKNSSHNLSQSPTLASSYSQKSLLAHSYKNQPFPKELKRKIWVKQFDLDLDYFSDEEEEITAVVQEEQLQNNQKKIKKLPHFKVISDQGQFLSKRSRIKSAVQFRYRQKCKSVQSLKYLPRVEEEKKEEDELKMLQRSKLSYFKDKNQFNQRKRNSSDSHTEVASKVQSLQNLLMPSASPNLPEEIEQNEAQQTKSVKLPGERSISITAEIQKLIVDELDSRKRKQQSKPQQIQQIIEQQKLQQQDQGNKISKLRLSLDKFQTQSGYLKQLRDQQIVHKSGKESEANSQKEEQDSQGEENKTTHHEVPLQREKLQYEEIRECSSSGKQDDYQDQEEIRAETTKTSSSEKVVKDENVSAQKVRQVKQI